MKKLIIIISFLVASATAFSQIDLLGFDTTASHRGGKIHTITPTLLLHPIIPINSTTIGFDTARYFMQTFTKNASGDSTFITFQDGTVFGLPSGSINGTGTSGYLSKWTDTRTQANSSIYYSGTGYGVGTTTPLGALEILATAGPNTTPNNLVTYNSRTVGTADVGSGMNFLYRMQTAEAYDRAAAQTIITWKNATDVTRIPAWIDYLNNNTFSAKSAISRVLQTDQTNVFVGINNPADPLFALDVVGGGRFTDKIKYSTNPTMLVGDGNVLTNKFYVDSVKAVNTTAIALKVNISDTAAMLSNYRSAIVANGAAIAGKQNTITTGTTAQYFRGDLSLATFPVSASLSTANIFTTNGALSAPSQTFNGTWITGGSTTTTKPYLLIEPTGTTSTGWATVGTGLGINAASGFTGRFIDLQLNGVTAFSVSSTGAMTTSSNIVTSGGFVNSTTSANASIQVPAAGSTVTRNIADANPTLKVTQQHASSTGDILQLNNSGGNVFKVSQAGNATAVQYRISALNTAPTSATDTGTLGEIRITATFIYVCTATNTWVRAALATW